MENVNNLLNEMDKLGLPTAELREKFSEAVKEEVFVAPRVRTSREEKLYTVAEKVLDKTFSAYGVVKDKAIPRTVSASKSAVVRSRSFVGSLLKRVGEKIEPKKS